MQSKAVQPAQSAGKCVRARPIDFSLTSDWMTKWRQFFKPIAWRGNAKPDQMRITFVNQVKTTQVHRQSNPIYNKLLDRNLFFTHLFAYVIA